ncbi:hypothetical protein [Zunongwangia sp.]|uniref:hypothetical protein n=1 Tax=Zunongwangia sp. TaxID=1965325 RepID=UPI003AA7E8F5
MKNHFKFNKIVKADKFINEALKNCKTIAADGEGVEFLEEKNYANLFKDDKAILLNKSPDKFIAEIAN